MRFIDLAGTTEYDEQQHHPVLCKKVTAKRQKGHPSNFEWSLTFTSEVKGDSLPELPRAFASSRAKALEAMEGGVAMRDRLDKFARTGKVSIIPLRNGEMFEADQAADLTPCTVTDGELSASEGVARITWKVVLIADSARAQELVELAERDVWIRTELAPGNAQLQMFDGKPISAPDVENGIPVTNRPRKTRRGNKRRPESNEAVVS